MNFVDFLSRARVKISDVARRSSLLTTTETLNVIFGNEACDLDSAVSALVYAWFLTRIQSIENRKKIYHIPVLNIPQNMFRLKTETVHLLKKFEISQNDLIFQDTVDFHDLFCNHKQNVKITLLDHHVLSRSDEYLYPMVSEVIDHRTQAREYDSDIKVEIATVGSCTTLIAERIIKAIDREELMLSEKELKEITLLVTGPILLDTVNLQESAGKVTERDLNVIGTFWKNNSNEQLAQIFIELSEAKYSADGLTVEDLMLKDAKFIENKDCTIKLFLSTIHDKMENFLHRDDAVSCIPILVSARNCHLWLALAPLKNDESEKPFKPLLLFSENHDLTAKVKQALISSETPCLQIIVEDSNGISEEFTKLRMYNIKASRKQILPVVQQAID
ncbi:exopolyphosphatase PRUNE1-like [Styela clava]